MASKALVTRMDVVIRSIKIKTYPKNAPKYLVPEDEFTAELLNADPQKGIVYLRFAELASIAFLGWMSAFYNDVLRTPDRLRYEIKSMEENQIVAVNIRNDCFIRAIVTKVDKSRITIRDADKGDILSVPSDWIFNLHDIFFQFSFQAVPCQLHGLEIFFDTDATSKVFKKLDLKSHAIRGRVSRYIKTDPIVNGVVSVYLHSLEYNEEPDLNAIFLKNIPLVLELGATK